MYGKIQTNKIKLILIIKIYSTTAELKFIWSTCTINNLYVHTNGCTIRRVSTNILYNKVWIIFFGINQCKNFKESFNKKRNFLY